MATTLRSGLRRKVDPFQCQGIVTCSKDSVLCAFRWFSSGTASLWLASSASLRSATISRRNFAGSCAAPSVPIGRVYGCGTIGYLLLCIWHIVKLIERDDKIAMFFDVKRGERLARERTDSAVAMKRKREEERRETKGRGERKLREGGGLT